MRSKTLALSLLLLSACGGGGDGATLSGNAETEFAAIKSTYQERRFEEASASLDAFLQANPEYTLGWILQGNARREMGLSLSAKEPTTRRFPWTPFGLRPTSDSEYWLGEMPPKRPKSRKRTR